VAIYVVVAACSSGGGGAIVSLLDAGKTGADSTALLGGDSSMSRDGAMQSLLDALTDPVAKASADTPDQSGTRLKVQRYVGSDGSSLAAGLYDSQLQTQCVFGLASDGTTRCLPPQWAVAEGWFADSACSVALAYVYDAAAGCTAPPSYAFLYGTQCGGRYTQRIFPVAGPFTGTAYSGTPSTCTAGSPLADALYSLGAELPPSTFVQATLTTDP
jgi:hypothetical protein